MRKEGGEKTTERERDKDKRGCPKGKKEGCPKAKKRAANSKKEGCPKGKKEAKRGLSKR